MLFIVYVFIFIFYKNRVLKFVVRWGPSKNEAAYAHKLPSDAPTEEANEGHEAACAMCLGVFEANTQIRVAPCGHIFCAECLEGQARHAVGDTRLRCALCRTYFIRQVAEE